MRAPSRQADGTAGAKLPRGKRPPAPRHAVLHLRPRNRRPPSVVLHGPFDTETDAIASSDRLRRRAAASDRIELLSSPGAWLAGGGRTRDEQVDALARRLLGRLARFPADFDPRAADALRPPGALFALACMEAPFAARRLAQALQHTGTQGREPAPALIGQVLLDVPHETAMLLLAVRWPAHWFAGRGRAAPDALRPADAQTACAVLARRLRRGRWPGRRTKLPHRIPEALYQPR